MGSDALNSVSSEQGKVKVKLGDGDCKGYAHESYL